LEDHYTKSDWTKALKYFDMHLKTVSNDMETLLLVMQALTENQQFDLLAARGEELTQPLTRPQFIIMRSETINLSNLKRRLLYWNRV